MVALQHHNFFPTHTHQKLSWVGWKYPWGEIQDVVVEEIFSPQDLATMNCDGMRMTMAVDLVRVRGSFVQYWNESMRICLMDRLHGARENVVENLL